MFIDAISQVLVSEGRPFYDLLHESSGDTDLIFLGMATPREDFDFRSYYENLQARTANLPTTAFVLAAPGFAFGEVLSKKL